MLASHHAPAATWLAVAATLLVTACSSPASFGAPCTAATGCGGGLACIPSFPGGYCSATCTEAMPCSAGAICEPDLAGGLCLGVCRSRADCRDGYQCWEGACRLSCGGDAECGALAVCVAGQCTGAECATSTDCDPSEMCIDATCVPMPDAGMVEMPDGGTLGDGAPCTESRTCISGLCLPPDRGGICSRACTDASSCFSTVTFSSACGPAVVDGVLRTACLPFDDSASSNAAPCSTDLDCSSRTCAGGLCSEACDGASDCQLGEQCTDLSWSDTSFRGCGYPPRSGVETLEIDLGMHDIAAGSGTTGLTFGVPADAISVTLRAEHVSGDDLPVAFYTVTSPSDEDLYSLSGFSDFVDQTIRWYPVDGEEAIAMLVPNTTEDRFAFEIGRYPFGVAAFGTSGSVEVHLTALVKRAPRTIAAGQLDLAIHLVGVGLTAASAPGNARVAAMLARMDEILSQVGITVGTVTYHEVPSGVASRLAIIDTTEGPDSELAELFRLSEGRTGLVLPLFLVRSIEAGGDGFNTLGIAGGIPGTSGIYGTQNSGVVVSFDSAAVGTGTTAGHVSSHESGHFLGLFHVTESRRACGVGETPGDTCLPFGATDVIDDTTRGDTGNLMHWSIVGSGRNDELSAGQGFVLLRSPIVR